MIQSHVECTFLFIIAKMMSILQTTFLCYMMTSMLQRSNYFHAFYVPVDYMHFILLVMSVHLAKAKRHFWVSKLVCEQY